MFIRLKLKDGGKTNLNINYIIAFNEQIDGTVLALTDGANIRVEESARAIRSAIQKKSIFPGKNQSAEAPEAEAAE